MSSRPVHRPDPPPPDPPTRTLILLVSLGILVSLILLVTASGAYGVPIPHARVTVHYQPPDPVTVVVQPAATHPTVWDELAECESHGQWDYDENSGWGSGIYDGGLQFDPDTWLAFGGGEYAPTADRATREQQIAVAERVLDAQGWKAWPACSIALGLR